MSRAWLAIFVLAFYGPGAAAGAGLHLLIDCHHEAAGEPSSPWDSDSCPVCQHVERSQLATSPVLLEESTTTSPRPPLPRRTEPAPADLVTFGPRGPPTFVS